MIAVAEGLDNHTARVPVKELWQQSWENVAQLGLKMPERIPMSKPGVKTSRARCFHETLSHLHRSNAAPGVEGGDVFSINPLVDFYNALSLQHSVPQVRLILTHLINLWRYA
ncbi:MAG: hypothetical protein CM1200mP20_09420 [Pseudomonadota bacterium]|nr:MAG: hypothetical protein CM1200mP20_09420 [Pseudomonadota bacterium]